MLLQSQPPKLWILTDKQRVLQSHRIAVQCYFEQGHDLNKAAAAYSCYAHDSRVLHVSRAPRYIIYQVTKFLETSSVTTRPYKKHEGPVPNEVAAQFALKLASGCAQQRWLWVNGRLVECYYHRRFLSIADAYSHDLYIQQIIDTCPSLQQLIRQAKHQNPDLGYCWQHICEDISAEVKESRQKYSKERLTKLKADSEHLLNFFWEDEIKVYVGSDKEGKVRVWGSKRELRTEPPQPCPFVGSHKQVCFHLLIVSSARYGIVYWNTMTGTTLWEGDLIKPNILSQAAIERRNHEYYKARRLLLKQYACNIRLILTLSCGKYLT